MSNEDEDFTFGIPLEEVNLLNIIKKASLRKNFGGDNRGFLERCLQKFGGYLETVKFAVGVFAVSYNFLGNCVSLIFLCTQQYF